MFIVWGTGQKQESIGMAPVQECNTCGRPGSIEIIMVFSYFSLFWIPLIKWGRKYYARMTCCGSQIELDKELGEAIRKGQAVELRADMFPRGTYATQAQVMPESKATRLCPHCGFEVEESALFCSHCGQSLDQ